MLQICETKQGCQSCIIRESQTVENNKLNGVKESQNVSPPEGQLMYAEEKCGYNRNQPNRFHKATKTKQQ